MEIKCYICKKKFDPCFDRNNEYRGHYSISLRHDTTVINRVVEWELCSVACMLEFIKKELVVEKAKKQSKNNAELTQYF